MQTICKVSFQLLLNGRRTARGMHECVNGTAIKVQQVQRQSHKNELCGYVLNINLHCTWKSDN